MQLLNQLFSTLQVMPHVFHNGQYCGNWQVDTSGSGNINFHFISHGTCYLHTEHDDVITLSKGDFLLMPTDSGHFLSPYSQDKKKVNTMNSVPVADSLYNEDPVLMCGYFSHAHPFISALVAHLPDYLVVSAQQDRSPSLHAAMSMLMTESLRPNQHVALDTYLLEKLAEIVFMVLARDQLSVDSPLLIAYAHPKLAPSIQAMHDTPEQKWTVDSLAKLSHMSRSSYASLFKRTLSMTPIDYLTNWRCACAYRDLSRLHSPVIIVANKYGYENEASFTKAFKRVMGVTPGKLRSSSVKNDDS